MDYKRLITQNAMVIIAMVISEFSWADFEILHWSIALGITNGLWLIKELGV